MELSKILFGDPILPVFGIEKSQLVKNTTQESGYSPTFLSKYHIGDIVLGKILENLGNGKGTFLINGTVLAGYMPEYLKQNDVLSFQLQRSQTGEVALLLHSVPNSHNEKTRFSAEQIASLLGIENENEEITSAINALKNSGQPITKEAIFTLLRMVENARTNPLLKTFSSADLFATIESMLQEGVPLSEKNFSLFAQSVGSFEKLEDAFKSIIQNGRLPENLPLRQAIIRLSSILVPLINSNIGQKNLKELSKKQLEDLEQSVLAIGAKYLRNSEAISATFSSLFSGELTKAEEKIALFELYKHLNQFLLAHQEVTKEDVATVLAIKKLLTTEKNITQETLQQSLKTLHSIFLHALSKPETLRIDLHLQEQQLQQITPKLLLLSESRDKVEILQSLEQYIRNFESSENEQFLHRERLQSIVIQLFSIAENKQLPPSTKMELLHSMIRAEISTSNAHDASSALLLSFLNDLTFTKDNATIQLQKFSLATEMLFKKVSKENSVNPELLSREITVLFTTLFPKNVQTSLQKELDALVQTLSYEEFQQHKQVQNQHQHQKSAVDVKEQFQQSYKEVLTSAVEILKKFVLIPENSRTIDQIEAVKNISVILQTLGAFEAYNSVATTENLPMYLMLPLIVEINKQRQFELKRIRIERHKAGDDKEMYQFGFSIPTNKLSEVNVRGSYLDKRITMQFFVDTSTIKRTIETYQNELMDGLQEHGYSVVSLSITTKEQHQQLPPLHENLKHDWRV